MRGVFQAVTLNSICQHHCCSTTNNRWSNKITNGNCSNLPHSYRSRTLLLEFQTGSLFGSWTVCQEVTLEFLGSDSRPDPGSRFDHTKLTTQVIQNMATHVQTYPICLTHNKKCIITLLTIWWHKELHLLLFEWFSPHECPSFFYKLAPFQRFLENLRVHAYSYLLLQWLWWLWSHPSCALPKNHGSAP